MRSARRRLPFLFAGAAIAFLLPSLRAPEARAGAARSGSALYGSNCAYCHGTAGKGDGPNASKLKPPPPDLTRIHLSADAIAGVVRDGKNACPSWKSSLSADDIRVVAAYAKSLQH